MVMLLPPRGGPCRTIPEAPIFDITPTTRAWAALRFIEENPEKWDQRTWNHCFAGIVVWQHGNDLFFMSCGEVRRTAMDLLEIGPWRAMMLFGAEVTLPTLHRRVRRYFGKGRL